MDIRPIIVQKYLESLKEDTELDALFPLLLQAMNFEILSTPKEYKGFPQYGKDIVAIGKEGGKKYRYYFEIKAGNIDGRNWATGQNSVRSSLTMTLDHDFATTYPDFKELPIKVVLAFNGLVSGKARGLLTGFAQKEFIDKGISFEEWNIWKLTELFNAKLFGPYLFTDQNNTRLFNRVIVNLNVNDGVSQDFIDLMDTILAKENWSGNSRKIPRRIVLLFGTLNLIALVLYKEAKEYNNLDIAKRYLTHLLLRFWNWVLKNKLEGNPKVIPFFARHFMFYHALLREYLKRTVDIALLKDGLSHHEGGRYDEVGYTHRTFEYLKTLCYVLKFEKRFDPNFDMEKAKSLLIGIINANSVSKRVLLDIHSLTVMDVIHLFIEFGELENAKTYLREVLGYIKNGKELYGRMPDANNSLENVIKFTVTGKKPIYYVDGTSPLLATLLEYVAILDVKEDYAWLPDFVQEHDITLGIFVPHQGLESTSRDLIEDKENDLEEQLFSTSVKDGYQSEIRIKKFPEGDLDFDEFREELGERVNEFTYNYRTDKAGFPMLRDLAHHYYETPYFPDRWRPLLKLLNPKETKE